MKIEIREERPPAAPERLAEAAAELAERGHPIPPSYRAFLAEQDGGDPVRDCFSFQEGDRQQSDLVRFFFGIAESPNGDLVEEVKAYAGRIPPGTLPIADDSFGNLLLLDGRAGGDGPVWFWDHELEPEGDEPEDANLSFVAPDLRSFLEQLTEDADPEPEPPERPRGLRRLFSR